MILFKACSRCGGDVDATYKEDVFCIQCAFRPPVADARSPLVEVTKGQDARSSAATNRTTPVVGCPRCALEDVIPLEKLRPHYNTCFRCRACGHIFSPGMPGLPSNASVASA